MYLVVDVQIFRREAGFVRREAACPVEGHRWLRRGQKMLGGHHQCFCVRSLGSCEAILEGLQPLRGARCLAVWRPEARRGQVPTHGRGQLALQRPAARLRMRARNWGWCLCAPEDASVSHRTGGGVAVPTRRHLWHRRCGVAWALAKYSSSRSSHVNESSSP